MTRAYYDHEPAYRRIAETGGAGWDDLAGASTDSYVALEAFLASSLAPPTAKVLDLGCGGGQAAIRLARRGYRVTGLDFARTAIALARRNAAELAFVVGDGLALPFADGPPRPSSTSCSRAAASPSSSARGAPRIRASVMT